MDEQSGDWVCIRCGVVAEPVINEHSEWRTHEYASVATGATKVPVRKAPMLTGGHTAHGKRSNAAERAQGLGR